MIEARKTVAAAGLLTLAGLIVTSSWEHPFPGSGRFAQAMWLLLPPLLPLVGAVLAEAWWSRWAALATGFAVLPWASALTMVPGDAPRLRALLALCASLALLTSLTGRATLQR